MLTGCADSLGSIFGNDGEIEVGEKVQFTTMVPDVTASSRSIKTEWEAKVKAYKAVQHAYTFNVEMWKDGATKKTASNTYSPKQTTNVGAEVIANYDGTLQSASETEMYWQDNTNKWGFKAEANNNVLSADQNSQEKWLSMDYLKGHSYLPIWTGEENSGSGTDPEQIQYKTNKEWYADNKTAKDLSGLMADENEGNNIYKKIPLYMQHQRSWITIILKAGDGVSREQLAYENSANTIKTTIYSYDGSNTATAITGTWRNSATVEYPNDKNGPEVSGASTTRYDAIVNPYSYYGQNDGNNPIASIDLSNQKFTFAAANDFEYENAKGGNTEALAVMNGYNLEPGKHLTITATLSRASRMVLITAWVEDWTETITSTVCDDYGQKGDPVIISTKQKLVDFLASNKNQAGYVGIISANTLDLDEDNVWVTDYDLKATLNVAGATLKTSKRLFKDITTSGSIVNGTIEVKDDVTVDEAIAEKNSGTIEHIKLRTATANSTSKATVAGFVKNNHGTIYQCSSNLNVDGTAAGFVGGIAATSGYEDENNKTILPVIDKCTVNARVDGAEGVKGGGIVGSVDGHVTNCTFEYGITLLQSLRNITVGVETQKAFNNIFQTAATTTKAYNNAWPTTATNPVPVTNPGDDQKNENIYSSKYDFVIDRQSELAQLLTTTYNTKDLNYRVSADFTVKVTQEGGDDSWKVQLNNSNKDNFTTFDNTGNIQFNLYGNGKTITLDGTKQFVRNYGSDSETVTTAPMLFCNIMGKIYDLTIDLKENIISEPTKGDNDTYNAEDAISPLAYSLYGEQALLSNVRVKSSNNKRVESATPAGLVVWALNGARIENCVVDIPVKMWMPSSMGTQSKHYAGGIVACAAKATIEQSQYQNAVTNATESAKGANFYYGGIVGGTVMKSVSGNNETPHLSLKDNSSWFTTSIESSNTTNGAIIGYAAYAENTASSTVVSGMADGNEGNWWFPSSKGAGTVASGTTETKAIGKRNSVTPTKR